MKPVVQRTLFVPTRRRETRSADYLLAHPLPGTISIFIASHRRIVLELADVELETTDFYAEQKARKAFGTLGFPFHSPTCSAPASHPAPLLPSFALDSFSNNPGGAAAVALPPPSPLPLLSGLSANGSQHETLKVSARWICRFRTYPSPW